MVRCICQDHSGDSVGNYSGCYVATWEVPTVQRSSQEVDVGHACLKRFARGVRELIWVVSGLGFRV